MSAQRYTDPVAHERMARGCCPECGVGPDSHVGSIFTGLVFTGCDLRSDGVLGRIAQYEQDQKGDST